MSTNNVKKDIFSDGLRFLLAGGANTLLTLVIYQFFLFYVDHGVAYSISWLIGLIFLIIIYPSKVFPEGRNTFIKKIQTSLFYLINFYFSLLLLDEVVSHGVWPQYAILIILVFTTTINFIGMRLILRGPVWKK